MGTFRNRAHIYMLISTLAVMITVLWSFYLYYPQYWIDDSIEGSGLTRIANDVYNMITEPFSVDVGGHGYDEGILAIGDEVVMTGSPLESLRKIVEKKPYIIEHVVEPGDTIWAIMKAYNVDEATIVNANSLINPYKLKVGQKLTFPSVTGVTHTVKSGDTVYDIAKKYQVNQQIIIEANDLQNGTIKVGQVLIIPNGKLEEDTFVSILCGENVAIREMQNQPLGWYGWAWDSPLKELEGWLEFRGYAVLPYFGEIPFKVYRKAGQNNLYFGMRWNDTLYVFSGEKLAGVILWTSLTTYVVELIKHYEWNVIAGPPSENFLYYYRDVANSVTIIKSISDGKQVHVVSAAKGGEASFLYISSPVKLDYKYFDINKNKYL